MEHLANGDTEAEECIRLAKEYRVGGSTGVTLDFAMNSININSTGAYSVRQVVSSFYCAATGRGSNTAYFAAHATAILNGYQAGDKKWNQYIDWLIEELCEYESNQLITI